VKSGPADIPLAVVAQWVKSGPDRDRGLQWSARSDERGELVSPPEVRALGKGMIYLS